MIRFRNNRKHTFTTVNRLAVLADGRVLIDLSGGDFPGGYYHILPISSLEWRRKPDVRSQAAVWYARRDAHEFLITDDWGEEYHLTLPLGECDAIAQQFLAELQAAELLTDEYPQLVAVCKQAIKACNRYKNGRCSTAFCLMRGGYTGGPVDYSLATCEGHELAQEIRRVAAMNDTSWAAQAMEESND